MYLSATLTRYIAGLFLLRFVSVMAVFAVVILLFDIGELLRRTATNPFARFDIVVAMALAKLPNVIVRVLPFAVLISAILSFWRLNRHHELEVTRGSGVSVWQLVLPLALCAFGLGIFALLALSPVASAFYARYQAMEDIYVGSRPTGAVIGGKSVWFRQPTQNGSYFLYAREIRPKSANLHGVMVLMMDDGDRFTGRVDAARARLGVGYWVLLDATLSSSGEEPRKRSAMRLETDLTMGEVLESFVHPATRSFWTIPGFVRVLETAGFSAVRYRLHWQTQLALPVLLAAVVLIAAAISLRPMRRGGPAIPIVLGLALGVGLFVLIDVAAALGTGSRIPIWVAAWSPVLIAMLLAGAMLFHLEDG